MTIERWPSWNGWILEHETLVLSYTNEDGRWLYEVDLERCTSSAEVLDWICQVAGKTWASDAVVAGLVHAIDDVLHPQANLCSCGESKEMSMARIRHLVSRGPVWAR